MCRRENVYLPPHSHSSLPPFPPLSGDVSVFQHFSCGIFLWCDLCICVRMAEKWLKDWGNKEERKKLRDRGLCVRKLKKRGMRACMRVHVFERKVSSMGVGYQLHNLFSVKGASSATYTKGLLTQWKRDMVSQTGQEKENITSRSSLSLSVSLTFCLLDDCETTKGETPEPLIWAALCHTRNAPLVWGCVSVWVFGWERPAAACMPHLPTYLRAFERSPAVWWHIQWPAARRKCLIIWESIWWNLFVRRMCCHADILDWYLTFVSKTGKKTGQPITCNSSV